MSQLDILKTEVFDYVRLRLGDGMVDVELDPQHYEMSLKKAFDKYRQRSSNAVEESYAFLELEKEVQQYTLDSNIIDVRSIFRRAIGSSSSSNASQFEPFEAGYLNTYMLQSGRIGGLLNYELYTGYQELSARMFGGFINYTWDKVNKKLTIVRKVEGDDEVVLLWVYNYRPDVTILQDPQSKPWIHDYTLAMCKFMLGEARSKFSTIAGPQGGTTLNGDALKQEAQLEMEKLEEDLRNFVDGSSPLSFTFG